MVTGLVNCIYSKNNETNNKKTTTYLEGSHFLLHDQRLQEPKGRKIRNVTDAHEVNRNEEIKKITK